METIKALFDSYFPRFITEYVACYEDDDGNLVPEMSMGMYEEQVYYDPGMRKPDGVVMLSSFNLFGTAIFPKQVGEAISYMDYLRLREAWL